MGNKMNQEKEVDYKTAADALVKSTKSPESALVDDGNGNLKFVRFPKDEFNPRQFLAGLLGRW
jgi:hypothetical protein